MKGDDGPSRPGRLQAVEKGNKRNAWPDSPRPVCKQAFQEFLSLGRMVLWALGYSLQWNINCVICIGDGRTESRDRKLGIS